MNNTTYSRDEVKSDARYSSTVLENDTDIIIDCFPEHAREDLRNHYREGGIIPADRNMNFKTNAMINYGLYNHRFNFSDKLIDAVFVYGFIEGQRYADRSR